MHCLFLGVAEHMTEKYMKSGIISKLIYMYVQTMMEFYFIVHALPGGLII